MTHYIIERNPSESAWLIREHETGKLLGTLTKKRTVFIAESAPFHSFSEGIDPLEVLRAVFHTSEFYQRQPSGAIHKLSPENLRAMMGLLIGGNSNVG